MILANILLAERSGTRVSPERMMIMGKAGTGKSRVLQALQWYALQIDAVRYIAAVAYTWRAALQLGTPDNPACTTTSYFAIDSHSRTGTDPLRTSGQVSNACVV